MKRLPIILIGILIFMATCGKSDPPSSSGGEVTSEKSKVYSRPPVSRLKDGPPLYPRNGARIHTNQIGNFDEIFNDSNYRQYEYAEKLGIHPLETLGDTYHTSRPLVKIRSGEAYHLLELTHSMPYLVPEAAWLLEDIGYAFIDSLKNRGASGYLIEVSSVLRSPYQVKRLRRVNKNAVDSSTHKFGTTFDIAYNNFHNTDPNEFVNPADLKQVLAEVLYDMRRQGRCMVKYEKKSPCFHITVTK